MTPMKKRDLTQVLKEKKNDGKGTQEFGQGDKQSE